MNKIVLVTAVLFLGFINLGPKEEKSVSAFSNSALVILDKDLIVEKEIEKFSNDMNNIDTHSDVQNENKSTEQKSDQVKLPNDKDVDVGECDEEPIEKSVNASITHEKDSSTNYEDLVGEDEIKVIDADSNKEDSLNDWVSTQLGYLINKYRQANGLNILRQSNILENHAIARSQEIDTMEPKDARKHIRADGSDWYTGLETGALYVENIVWGNSDPEALLNLWIQSPEHNANLLNECISEMGINVYSSNENYSVGVFIGSSK